VTIGKFDGLHAGHQHLVRQLLAEGRSRGLEVGVITFYPDPTVVLKPDQAVQYLMTPEERRTGLEALGLDFVLPWTFTRELAALKARQFVALLRADLRVSLILMGPDNRLGSDRLSFLEARAVAASEGVELLPATRARSTSGAEVSSSRVKADIFSGRLDDAHSKLERSFWITGTASSRGGEVDAFGAVTTLDVYHWPEFVLPPDGLYEGWVGLGGLTYFSYILISDRRLSRASAFGLDGDVVDQPVRIGLVRCLNSCASATSTVEEAERRHIEGTTA